MVITGTDILNDKLFLAAEARVLADTKAAAKKNIISGAGNERWQQIPNEGMYQSLPFKNESAAVKTKPSDCPRQDLNVRPPV